MCLISAGYPGDGSALQTSESDLPYFESHARKIADAVETVQHCCEIAGRDVDLCIEVHRRLAPYEAVQFGRALEPSYPLFLEDPVTPDNFDEMSYVAEKITIPVATGERMTSLWEFQMLATRQGAQIFRPDVCMVGGISGARKIAALAEASHIGVAPHNPPSAVSTAACLQIAATVPTSTLSGDREPLPNTKSSHTLLDTPHPTARLEVLRELAGPYSREQHPEPYSERAVSTEPRPERARGSSFKGRPSRQTARAARPPSP